MNDHYRKNKGQGLVEYIALTALVAVVCIGTVRLFGSKVRQRLTQVSTTFDRNIQQGLRTATGRGSQNNENGNQQPESPETGNSGFRFPWGQ
jgi:Flp pilus assembly pilin Flp